MERRVFNIHIVYFYAMTDNLTVYKLSYLERIWHITIDNRLQEVVFYRRHFNSLKKCRVIKTIPYRYTSGAIRAILSKCKHLIDEVMGITKTRFKRGFPVYV